MPQSSIFSLDPRHVGFADNLVPIRNVLRMHLVAIGDIKVALPETDNGP